MEKFLFLKRLELFFFIFIAVIVFSGCVQGLRTESAQFPESDFKAYDGGWFLIKYPVVWSVQKQDNLTFFAEPLKNAKSMNGGLASFLWQSLSEEISLQKFVENSVSQLQESLADFKLKSVKPVELNQLPAYEIGYSALSNGIELDYLQVLAVENGKGFVLTLAGKESDIESFAKIFEIMRDSVELKKDVLKNFSEKKIQSVVEENIDLKKQPVVSIEEQSVVRNWRAYSETVYFDNGNWAFLETPVELLELNPDHTWKFGKKSGIWEIKFIEEIDWGKWGIGSYGPVKKIVLYDWVENGFADGPLEEDGDRIDYLWLIYRGSPPEIKENGQIQLKFGWNYID